MNCALYGQGKKRFSRKQDALGKANETHSWILTDLRERSFNNPILALSARPALTCPCIHPKIAARGVEFSN
jgi:hypothetical protein